MTKIPTRMKWAAIVLMILATVMAILSFMTGYRLRHCQYSLGWSKFKNIFEEQRKWRREP